MKSSGKPSSRPITFPDAMVRAILEGRKTQARFPIKNKIFSNGVCYSKDLGDIVCHDDHLPPSEMMMEVRSGRDRHCIGRCEGWDHFSPFGQVGDHLWVREAWDISRGAKESRRDNWKHQGWALWYRADEARVFTFANNGGTDFMERSGHWRRSIHMPKWASRIMLEIIDVRAEKLHNITEQDAENEGVTLDPICGKLNGEPATLYPMSHTQALSWIWDSKHKNNIWHSNPWVWKIEFRKI